ncbi:hypothetical protein [Streptomyces formicae]
MGIPAMQAGGRELPGLVLGLDTAVVTCHSEQQDAAPTYKGGFGHHPLPYSLANTGGALAGRLRPGNAGSNTAADHITVLDDARTFFSSGHAVTEPVCRAIRAVSDQLFAPVS